MIYVEKAKFINYIMLVLISCAATYIGLLLGLSYPQYAPDNNPQYLALLFAAAVIVLIISFDKIFKLTIKDLKKRKITPSEFYAKSPLLNKRAVVREYAKYCGTKEEMVEFLTKRVQ